MYNQPESLFIAKSYQPTIHTDSISTETLDKKKRESWSRLEFVYSRMGAFYN